MTDHHSSRMASRGRRPDQDRLGLQKREAWKDRTVSPEMQELKGDGSVGPLGSLGPGSPRDPGPEFEFEFRLGKPSCRVLENRCVNALVEKTCSAEFRVV